LLISTFFHRLSSRLTLKLQTYGPPYSTPLLKHGVLLLFRLLPPSLLALTFTSYTDEQTGLDYALAALVYIILLVVPALQPLALTGSISTGKSTVSKLLNSECSIIDLDKIAHEILLPTCSYGVYDEVVKAFGAGILDEDGTINRTALGAVIFKDAKERRKLNGITHPRIRYRMVREMLVRKIWEKEPRVLVDIPLLFESKLQSMFSTIIVVALEEEEQLKRLIKRNPELTPVQCAERIKSQLPMSFKTSRADVVIDNSSTLSALTSSVSDLMSQMVSSAPVVEIHEAFACVFLVMTFLHVDMYSVTLQAYALKGFLMIIL